MWICLTVMLQPEPEPEPEPEQKPSPHYVACPRSHWVTDGKRSRCGLCGAEFGLLTRRHHCRRCGDVFCDDCTAHSLTMRHSAAEATELAVPQRVCSGCARDTSYPADFYPGSESRWLFPSSYSRRRRGPSSNRIHCRSSSSRIRLSRGPSNRR